MQELIDQLNQYQPYTGVLAFILANVIAATAAIFLHRPSKKELSHLEE